MDQQNKITQPVLRNPNGTPTPQNPGLTLAQFGPAPIGVPNPVIDSFEIPPFLLPIYQSCGTEYGIPGRCSPRSTRSRRHSAPT